jgi:hypothetical protein
MKSNDEAETEQSRQGIAEIGSAVRFGEGASRLEDR